MRCILRGIVQGGLGVYEVMIEHEVFLVVSFRVPTMIIDDLILRQ